MTLPTRNIATAFTTVRMQCTYAFSEIPFFNEIHLSTVSNKIPKYGYSFCFHLSRHIFCVEWPVCNDIDIETS